METFAVALDDCPRPLRSPLEIEAAMRRLQRKNLLDLPLPASGNTHHRWRALAAVGAFDLSLAKIYEGHTDAVAILAELRRPQPDGLWGVWAADHPALGLIFHEGHLTGRKEWCSGAAIVDQALVTAWTREKEPVLVRVALSQKEIALAEGGWRAVGMAGSQSIAATFAGARAEVIGEPNEYGCRPGFWHGGAGIAAVWYGATVAIADALVGSGRVGRDAHAAAHLGAMDSELRAARALLVETASWIDENPKADATAVALRLRATVEAAANDVLLRTGRALGPAPLCSDAIHAQRCADLPVFLRQSHAERDLAALGLSMAGDSTGWAL